MLQFYKVEVTVLPPEGKGPPKIRSVLRRYNHFTKLHTKVHWHLLMCGAYIGRQQGLGVGSTPSLGSCIPHLDVNENVQETEKVQGEEGPPFHAPQGL